MLVDGKVAVVTGGSRGIGEKVAEVLANEGANVIVGDLNLERSDTLTIKISTELGNIYEAQLDITDISSVKNFFKKIMNKFGQIDILVNNAGICKDITPFESMGRNEWDVTNEVNVMGTVNCTKEVIPVMKSQKSGKIINLASIAGEIGGSASSIAYSASKTSIICISKVLAKQLGPEGITVNSVAPGYIITEMTKTHVHDLSNVPLRRRGTTLDVANAILFLSSEMGSYITGTTLDVNGGVYMN